MPKMPLFSVITRHTEGWELVRYYGKMCLIALTFAIILSSYFTDYVSTTRGVLLSIGCFIITFSMIKTIDEVYLFPYTKANITRYLFVAIGFLSIANVITSDIGTIGLITSGIWFLIAILASKRYNMELEAYNLICKESPRTYITIMQMAIGTNTTFEETRMIFIKSNRV